MNKKIWWIVLVVIIVVLGAYVIFENKNQPAPAGPAGPAATTFDPLNATYVVQEGQPVTFVNGLSVVTGPVPPGEKVTTKIWGQPEFFGDLNNDGKLDAAVFITQDTGGSGTFYYISAAIDTGHGAQGTNSFFLGDRIAPQNIEIRDGQIIVNYADRKPSDSYAVQPSVGVSKFFKVDGLKLVTSSLMMQ